MKLTMTILLVAGMLSVNAAEQSDCGLEMRGQQFLHCNEQQDLPSGCGIEQHSLQGNERQDIQAWQAREPQDPLRVMFWNLENFYDTKDEGKSESDSEFSSGGARHWTSRLYSAKCNGVSKIILKVADARGSLPDAIGFAEVENREVVEDIVLDTPLRKLGYRIVHFDSPDHRGIDCALLYRKSKLELTDSKALHLYDNEGGVIATRDILMARFGELAILVNHHPSKVGDNIKSRVDSGKSVSRGKDDTTLNQIDFGESRRVVAMKRMLQAVDSLESEGVKRILCIGDFNDDLWSEKAPSEQASPLGSIKETAPDKMLSGETVTALGKMFSSDTLTTASGGPPLGTIRYEGEWEKIDGCFTRGFTSVEELIFDDPSLLTKDNAYGGLKPLRTWSGPRCLGGISDHLPIVVTLFY